MIKVNDSIYIRPEDRQFVLLRETFDKEKKPVYFPIGYFTSMALAIKKVIQMDFSEEISKDVYSIEQAVKKYEEISQRYEKYII